MLVTGRQSALTAGRTVSAIGIARASPRFWDTKSPFYDRLPKVPGFGVDVKAEEIGWIGTAAVGGAMLAQVIGNMVRDRVKPPPKHDEPTDTSDSKQP